LSSALGKVRCDEIQVTETRLCWGVNLLKLRLGCLNNRAHSEMWTGVGKSKLAVGQKKTTESLECVGRPQVEFPKYADV